MRKFIASMIAAGALAAGGAASAQDFGSVVGNVLGSIFGTPQTSQPAVVAPGYGYGGGYGTVYTDQYGRRFTVDAYGRPIYLDQRAGSYGRTVTDQYGRQVYLDQHGSYTDSWGNRVFVDAYGRHTRMASYRDQWGRIVYTDTAGRPLYIEQNGQLSAYVGTTSGQYAYSNRDRDGDGVANWNDRYPDDPRYR